MRLIFIILLSIIIEQAAQAQINGCAKNNAIHLVVLGSSTAAGAGSSHLDSAWVNRYRRYLKRINPSNQVTNLARGGYNTYKIQADNYIPPNNRPTVDSTRNISTAIRLNPDGIIVNLPSNDAAIGIGLNEQMDNFIRLKNVADSFNIPIWICTTQPRNFSLAQRTIQIQTRDSILNYFGSYAIDFWSGLANTNNGVLSTFDSGDGVHLNDTGHSVLSKRVIQKFIPNLLADTLHFTDYMAFDIEAIALNDCGDSLQAFSLKYANIGASASQLLRLEVESTLTNADTITIQTGKNLDACEIDSSVFQFNTSRSGPYELQLNILNVDSSLANNQSSRNLFQIIGTPSSIDVIDTICRSDSVTIINNKQNIQDQTVWYRDAGKSALLSIGDSLQVKVSQDTTFYFETVRGPLVNVDELFTGTLSTTNWNGIMFDIVAQDSITLDSLMIKLFDTGQKQIEGYYRRGSYSGNENLPSQWTYWGLDSVNVQAIGDFRILNYPDIQLLNGDTLGIYIHLQSANSRLSYRSSSAVQSLSDGKLEVISGSGISHTFGSTFSPRNFVGTLFYHYGQNLEGDCSSGINKYEIILNESAFDLGPDTTIAAHQNLQIQLPSSFSSILWSTGDTSRLLLLNAQNLNTGSNLISLNAIDENGCSFSDSIIVFLNFGVHVHSNAFTPISLSPNPARSILQLENLPANVSAFIYDLSGRMVQKEMLSPAGQISIRDLKNGTYILELRKEEQQYRQLFIKQ